MGYPCHEYSWIPQYLHLTRMMGTHTGTRAETCIIFMQRSGYEYHIIRTYGYPLTSLILKKYHGAVIFLWWPRFEPRPCIYYALSLPLS